MSLSNKEQIALMSFLVALILGLGGFFLVWPQIKVWPDNKAELAERQAENQKMDTELVREATIDNEILEAYDDSVSAGGFFYNEMNAPQADKTVRNFLLSAGARIKAEDLTELKLASPSLRGLSIEAASAEIKFPEYDIGIKADVASGLQMGGVAAETSADGTPVEGGEAPAAVVAPEASAGVSEAKVLYDNYYEQLSRMDATAAIDFFKQEEKDFESLTDTEKKNRSTALVGAMADFLAANSVAQNVGAYDVKVKLYLRQGMFAKLQEAALTNKIQVMGDDGKFTEVRKAIGITQYTADSKWNGVSKSPAGMYDFTVTLYCVKPITKPAYLIQLEQQRGTEPDAGDAALLGDIAEAGDAGDDEAAAAAVGDAAAADDAGDDEAADAAAADDAGDDEAADAAAGDAGDVA